MLLFVILPNLIEQGVRRASQLWLCTCYVAIQLFVILPNLIGAVAVMAPRKFLGSGGGSLSRV